MKRQPCLQIPEGAKQTDTVHVSVCVLFEAGFYRIREKHSKIISQSTWNNSCSCSNCKWLSDQILKESNLFTFFLTEYFYSNITGVLWPRLWWSWLNDFLFLIHKHNHLFCSWMTCGDGDVTFKLALWNSRKFRFALVRFLGYSLVNYSIQLFLFSSLV